MINIFSLRTCYFQSFVIVVRLGICQYWQIVLFRPGDTINVDRLR